MASVLLRRGISWPHVWLGRFLGGFSAVGFSMARYEPASEERDFSQMSGGLGSAQ